MTASKVAWPTLFSPYNQTAAKAWNNLLTQYSLATPDVDFWKVGHSMVAGTETFPVGMTWNIKTASGFHPYPFHNIGNILQGKSPIVFMSMPIHERIEPDGSLYASVSALDTTYFRSGVGTMIQVYMYIK